MANFECCYKCTKRHVGCHSDCEEYLATKKAYDEKKAILDKEKANHNSVVAYEISRASRINRHSAHQSMCGREQRRRRK